MHDTIIIKWFEWGLRCVFGGLRCVLRFFSIKITLFTKKMDSCKHKTGLILYWDVWYMLQCMIQSLSCGLDGVCVVFSEVCVVFAVCFEGFFTKSTLFTQKMDSCKHKNWFNFVLGCLVYPTMHDTIIIMWFGWSLQCFYGGLRGLAIPLCASCVLCAYFAL